MITGRSKLTFFLFVADGFDSSVRLPENVLSRKPTIFFDGRVVFAIVRCFWLLTSVLVSELYAILVLAL